MIYYHIDSNYVWTVENAGRSRPKSCHLSLNSSSYYSMTNSPLRYKDLLALLQQYFGNSAFDTVAVSSMLQNFSKQNPNLYLVDNPKGLTVKWISNDLNRLRLMSFLNRKRMKRPVLGLNTGFCRGFYYNYRISNRGFRYLQRMKQSGFRLSTSSPHIRETNIYRWAENLNEFDVKKAAERQRQRIQNNLAPRLDPRFSSLGALDQQLYLAQLDRGYRRSVGFNQRYTMRRQIADLQQEVQRLQMMLARYG